VQDKKWLSGGTGGGVIISIARPPARAGREDEEKDRETERGSSLGFSFCSVRGKMARGPSRGPDREESRFSRRGDRQRQFVSPRSGRVQKPKTTARHGRLPHAERTMTAVVTMRLCRILLRPCENATSENAIFHRAQDVARYESRPWPVRTNQGRLPAESPQRRKNILSRNIIELL